MLSCIGDDRCSMINFNYFNAVLSNYSNPMDNQSSPQTPTHQQVEQDYNQLFSERLNRKISQLSDLQLRYTYSNASNASNGSQFSTYEPNNDHFQAKFVRDSQLYSQLMEKVGAIRNIVWIQEEDLCLYIYQYYGWNQEKLTSNYFNDDWNGFKDKQQEYVSFEKQLIGITGPCPICLQEEELYCSKMCQHRYCRNCWSSYIRAQLMNGQIFFGCMHEEQCVKAPVMKKFIDFIAPELSELNRKKICISYAIQDKNICYCPNQKCPYFCVKPNMMELHTVSCPCGEIYCYKCRNQPHFPASCKDVDRWQSLINSEETNGSWIRNNTKQCPQCRQPIEKKVGCSHMKCICQCQFCYECQRLWDLDHIAAKTQCPTRYSLISHSKQINSHVELNEQLQEMIKQTQKHKICFKQCQQLIQDQLLKSRVVHLRTEVISSWMTIKWTKIWLCMEDRPFIDSQLQKQFIQSIRSVMEPVFIILKNYKNLILKQLHYYGEQVLQRKQILKKNEKIWLQAWQATVQN